MKKGSLILLLVLALSFSTMVAAESLDGYSISLENILTQDVVEIQAVSAPDFGGMAVLSVCLSEQVVVDKIMITADIGLEMGNYNINDIDGSRGGRLPIASLF